MTRRKHRLPMSAPMIRAIEREIEAPGTGKTQTRRICKDQSAASYQWVHECPTYPKGSHFTGWAKDCGFPFLLPTRPPYGQPGDLLAFTETWAFGTGYDELPPREVPAVPYIGVWYSADDEPPESNCGRWRPARFMPYWCSRYTGVVTDVRVERVQEIGEADARAEGVEALDCRDNVWTLSNGEKRHWRERGFGSEAQCLFADLWGAIHGEGAWLRNDWVWVYTFRPIAANVLHVEHDPAAYGVEEEIE